MTIRGQLYLIPCTLGDSDINSVLPTSLLSTINTIDIYIVEEIKAARRFLKKAGIVKSIDELEFKLLNEHTKADLIEDYLDEINSGKNIGLLSEAGCPIIADPGNSIVKLAHSKGIKVVPVVGPSSVILSLMASGFSGQNFTFHGYLPKEKSERIQKIREMERLANNKNQTQIFIETPYRNNSLIDDILTVCNNDTLFCVAADLTLPNERVITQAINQWKKNKPDYNKQPAVFLIGK